MQLLLAPTFFLFAFCLAKDECQPSTWSNYHARRADATMTSPAEPEYTFSNEGTEDPKPGDVVCYSYSRTYDKVNYFSCQELADYHDLYVEEFFMWNPEIKPDCSNIRPYTFYCIGGCKSFLLIRITSAKFHPTDLFIIRY